MSPGVAGGRPSRHGALSSRGVMAPCWIGTSRPTIGGTAHSAKRQFGSAASTARPWWRPAYAFPTATRCSACTRCPTTAASPSSRWRTSRRSPSRWHSLTPVCSRCVLPPHRSRASACPRAAWPFRSAITAHWSWPSLTTAAAQARCRTACPPSRVWCVAGSPPSSVPAGCCCPMVRSTSEWSRSDVSWRWWGPSTPTTIR